MAGLLLSPMGLAGAATYMYYKKKPGTPIKNASLKYNIGSGNKTGVAIANLPKNNGHIVRSNNGKIINIPRANVVVPPKKPLFSFNQVMNAGHKIVNLGTRAANLGMKASNTVAKYSKYMKK